MNSLSKWLFVAVAVINLSIIGMTVGVIYFVSDGRSFADIPQDLLGNFDLFVVNFFNPFVLMLACVWVLVASNRKISRPSIIWAAPLTVFVLGIICNLVLSGGLGLIVLSAPFLFAAYFFLIKKTLGSG